MFNAVHHRRLFATSARQGGRCVSKNGPLGSVLLSANLIIWHGPIIVRLAEIHTTLLIFGRSVEGSDWIRVMDELNREIARSLEATPELLPFLPKLLADVWALGSSVEIIVDLLRQVGINDSGRVFDVGCGKGAAAVSLAKENGCHVYGIDGFEPFIAEARTRARDAGVAELCTFECGDMREAVLHARDYDAAIYAAHSSELAGRPCVEVLRQCVRHGGYILIDDGFLADGVDSTPPGYEGLLPRDGIVAALTAHGDRVVREVTQSPETWHADENRIVDSIRRRAETLAVLHPQAAGPINEYVRLQEREYATLKAIHIPATWLLQRC